MVGMVPGERITAEAIERAMALVPVTRPVERKPAAAPIAPAPPLWAPPEKGAHACRMHCGTTLEYPGICAACDPSWRYARAVEQMQAVFEKIPEAYRRPSDDDLRRICRGFLRGLDAPTMVRIVATGIVECKFVNYVLLDPDSGTGKSVFAGAVADEIARRATRALCDAPPDEEGKPEPPVVALARGFQFVSAVELIRTWGDGDDAEPPALERAIAAPFLWLDDCGQEGEQRGDSSRSSARRSAVARLLVKRWDRKRRTLITTFASYRDAIQWYGGGVARRLYKDDTFTCVVPKNVEARR